MDELALVLAADASAEDQPPDAVGEDASPGCLQNRKCDSKPKLYRPWLELRPIAGMLSRSLSRDLLLATFRGGRSAEPSADADASQIGVPLSPRNKVGLLAVMSVDKHRSLILFDIEA